MAFTRRDPAAFTDREAFLNQVTTDYFDAIDAGGAPDPEELLQLYPELEPDLRALLEAHGRYGGALEAARDGAEHFPERLGAFGDYDLLETIGRGGMGVVYRARNRRDGRDVALKTLLGGRLLDSEARRRFERECLAAARLDHPHVVPLLEVGEAEGVPFYAMKRIVGGDLAARRGEFAANPRSAVELLAPVARAVEHAHRRGIVHRDLKPANILIAHGGHPYVTDFGLASAEVSQSLTQSGAVLGTPAYMSPELAAGTPGRSGPPADVYSLGVILFELVTGRLPFEEATTLDLLRAIQEETPPRPTRFSPGLRRDLETIVLRCLEKDPARRYADAGALAEDLERFLASAPIAARPVGLAIRTGRWCRRHPLQATVTAFLGFFGVACAIAAVAFDQQRAVARTAEGRAIERLRDSLIGQARLARRSEEEGQRRQALEAIQAAARIRADEALRDEAAAALALPDLRSVLPPEIVRPDNVLAAVDAEGARIAQYLAAGRIRVEPIQGGDALELAAPDTRGYAVREMRFSPRGDRLGAALEEAEGRQRLLIWSLAGLEIGPFAVKDLSSPRAWDFHPRDDLVLAGSRRGPLFRLDLVGSQRKAFSWVEDPAADQGRLICLRFDAEGGRIALALSRGVETVAIVRQWPGGRRLAEISLSGMPMSISWSPRADRLAIAVEKTIELWDITNVKCTAILTGHRSAVTSMDFSPRGDILASTSWDGSLRLWDPWRGRHLISTVAGNYGITFGRSGSRIAITSRRGEVSLLALERSPVLTELDDDRPSPNALTSAAFDPDSRRLAVAGHGGVRLWDLETHTPMAFLAAEGAACGVAFAPGGGELLAWGREGLFAWSLGAPESSPTPRRLASLNAGPDARDAAFSLKSGRLALVSDHRRGLASVAAWKGGEIEESAAVPLQAFLGFQHLVLSPDGRLAAAGERYVRRKVVRLWDASSGVPCGDLDVGNAARCAFSPDGTRLLTGTGTEHCLWEISGRKVLWSVARRSTSVLAGPGAFSPDGRLIAVTFSDHEIHLLEPAQGRKLLALTPPDPQIVKRLEFDRGGRVLAAVTEDNTVLLWDLEAAERELGALGLAWRED